MTHGSLALKLRVLRAERALTIEQAAVRAGVQPETISDAERGRRRPYLPTLRKLAAAYEVPVEEILSVDEEPALAGKAEAPSPGPATERGDLPSFSREAPEVEEVSEADRLWLSALLDPYTKQLRDISESYGPHLRLLPPDPSPDDLPRFAWIAKFREICLRMDRMVNDQAVSAAVGPWHSRMNDETVPVDIRRKLRDFEAAETELFDEVEPLAEKWLAAQRDRLPDEWLAKWIAELEVGPEGRVGPHRGGA
jgi:transcriptional regulator with XRE-family HTH domain